MPDTNNLTAAELQKLIASLAPTTTTTATTIDLGPTAPSGLRLVSKA
jgi:hypothetical protein